MSDRADGILAVHPGALGDVILFGRLLERLPGRKTLVASGEKARLLAGLRVVDEALDFEALPMHEIFSDAPAYACGLPQRLGPCERLVSCYAGDAPAARIRLAMLCGASSSAFLPIRPPANAQCHLLDVWADLLGLGVGAWREAPAWEVPVEWRDASRTLAGEGGCVVLHSGSGGLAKCWPWERFVALADELGREVIFVVGPAEVDRGHPATLAGRTHRVVVSPSLVELTGLLAGAAGYVGNDSGVSHLAAAVGAPTVALFGPTSPAQFRPVGPRVRVVARAALDDIFVADVAAALESVAG